MRPCEKEGGKTAAVCERVDSRHGRKIGIFTLLEEGCGAWRLAVGEGWEFSFNGYELKTRRDVFCGKNASTR